MNTLCERETVPSSNTRPQVAVKQQTTVEHSHYKEAFKRSASPLASEAGQMEAPGGFHQQQRTVPVTTQGEAHSLRGIGWHL